MYTHLSDRLNDGEKLRGGRLNYGERLRNEQRVAVDVMDAHLSGCAFAV